MTASPAPLTPESLAAGQRITGLVPGRAVTLVGVDLLEPGLCEVFHRNDSGEIVSRMVGADDASQLRLADEADCAPRFDADPNEFRLAAEAMRIKYAALYDPMVAVNSSDVDPLPHQIRAVYEELLPRIPLRFLLADDPGAGKTIMAGLYLKELVLRSDCERAIIVAPGGLVEQWREELATKFDLRFEVFNRHMVDDAEGRNVFTQHPRLIVRMDQISRSDDLMEQLSDVTWDVAVVDEAHRMSAHFSNWAGEVDETKRFRLGRQLSETAHNLLLMTATPHAGKEEDFQLFMTLLDRDRFEGQFRQGVHRTDTLGLMRRMVKEDLLTFEGKPLFPERRAYTVHYELSDGERDLYERVSDYVRTEMGRADRLAQSGDLKRRNNVGFALTVLQRRLASSPEAILKSLERRQRRLDSRLREMQRIQHLGDPPSLDASLPALSLADLDDLDVEVAEEERAGFESQLEQVVDLATAAQTIPELRTEIDILEELIRVARRVRMQDEDAKWVQLRTILDEQLLHQDDSGQPRKIIVFTEHRDTLDYLHRKIATQLGREDAVLTIHGATRREDRKAVREQFTHDPKTVVLLATDAAGEGLNLQRAHLMVNYDLPWNPNRIEQRFGRIHRIGQREVCHLWNMVAKDTREGDVFTRLLSKISTMSAAYNGNLFNVLGGPGAFQAQSLRDLLLEAIRYGDQPEVRAKLDQIIDASVTDGLEELLQERALHPEMFSPMDLDAVRRRMEHARARKLQPGYIKAFFIPAFERMGGQIRRRENERYEIVRVPRRVMDAARRINRWAPVPERYERVTFVLDQVQPDGVMRAELIAPGHPLLAAVIEETVADLGHTLAQGTVFVDRRPEQAGSPALLFTVEQRIVNSAVPPDVVSHHFDYPMLSPEGEITGSAAPPYLDFDHPSAEEQERLAAVRDQDWVRRDHEKPVRAWAFREGLGPRLTEIRERLLVDTERTRQQVRQRLGAEINLWDNKYTELAALEREGQVGRIRAEVARAKASELEARLQRRGLELDQAVDLAALPTSIRGAALVVPSALLSDGDAGDAARRTEEVERRAVALVLAAERALGRDPVEMARNNPGFDVQSMDAGGRVHYIEVKGRIAGSEVFTITANEVSFAQTQRDRHRLALVLVSPDGPEHDELRYVTDAFTHLEPSATTRSYNEEWDDYWRSGGPPC